MDLPGPAARVCRSTVGLDRWAYWSEWKAGCPFMTGATVRSNVQMCGPEDGSVRMLAHGFGTAVEEMHRVGGLFCGVDKFKQGNDTLGHAAGRGAGAVNRYSGDEFVVLIRQL